MKGYIEERAVEIANYIIDNNATVRQTAKQFGISKSTVHTDVTKWNVNQNNKGSNTLTSQDIDGFVKAFGFFWNISTFVIKFRCVNRLLLQWFTKTA